MLSLHVRSTVDPGCGSECMVRPSGVLLHIGPVSKACVLYKTMPVASVDACWHIILLVLPLIHIHGDARRGAGVVPAMQFGLENLPGTFKTILRVFQSDHTRRARLPL